MPKLSLKDIHKVPIAMFVGLEDDLADPTDTRLVRDDLENVVFYREYEAMDHSSFSIGKNMDYVKDVIDQLWKANSSQQGFETKEETTSDKNMFVY